MKVDLREFRAAYLAEVEEHIAAVNANLIRVEVANRSKQSTYRELRELMRLLHTIKGLSGMVSVDPIVDIAHRMESVVRNAERANRTLNERELEVIIAGTRAIETAIGVVAKNQPLGSMSASLLAELDAVAALPPAPDAANASADGATLRDPLLAAKLTEAERQQLVEGASAGRRAVRINFAPATAKADRGLTITTVRERLAAIGELVRVLPLTAVATDAAPGGLVFALVLLTTATDATIADVSGLATTDISEVLETRAVEPTVPLDLMDAQTFESSSDDVVEAHRSGVLRVEVERIDDTIDKLSTLIVTRSRLSRVVLNLRSAGVDTRELDVVVAETSRQLRDLRAAVLQLRMVPVATVLDRLPLVIRGLGRSAGKQVQLVLEGTGAELDKTVAERIFPALVHILRNAVDHGIETPDERRRAGKPETGTIRVSSVVRNRQLEIRIDDDGAGIDRARVASKAGRDLSEDDAALLELICRPGLSTREEADTTSGRGIGMDVARKVVVDSLGGELVLETKPGKGTTFIVRVPLTIAIVDSFMLRCAGERFVVPVPAVEEIVELDASTLVQGPRQGGSSGQFFARRGEPVALIDLADALGLATSSSGSAQALVVRRGREAPLAFAVERVFAQQETVVRPLLDPLVSVIGVSGSTDLGDGRATLVLDLLAIGAKLGRNRERAA